MQSSLGEGLSESIDKLAPEDLGQHVFRQEEILRTRLDPAAVIGRETAARQHTVDMDVVLDLLIPGMQNTEEADLGAQALGIASHLEQGFRARTQQQ